MPADRNEKPYSEDYELGPGFYDKSWVEPPKAEKNGGFRFSNTQERKDWIVRLTFKKDGKQGAGNGFYVNIPHPTYHVILTAGHNLVGIEKETLKLHPAPPGYSSNEVSFHIADAYEKDPTEKHAEDDYGIIKVKKNPARDYFGFGFALKLSHDKLDEMELTICGYRDDGDDDDDTKLRYVTESTGKCIISRPEQLEYEVSTEKGWSGAPVVIAYNHVDTIIGIHNYGPKASGKGSRGTRLTEKVLSKIYGWLEIGHYNKALQTFEPSQLPHSSLHLAFTPDSESAVVRLGYDRDRVTKFDILPAYAPPSNYGNPDDFRHVFRLWSAPGTVAEEKRWVLWDIVAQRVSLTHKLQDFCVIKLVKDPKQGVDTENGPYYAVVEVTRDPKEKASLKELRMSASDITDVDLLLGFTETPEVAFASNMKDKYLYGEIPSMPNLQIKKGRGGKKDPFGYNLYWLYSE